MFGAFQWARVVSPFKLLVEDDPVYAWRERLLDAFDGLARKSPGYHAGSGRSPDDGARATFATANQQAMIARTVRPIAEAVN